MRSLTSLSTGRQSFLGSPLVTVTETKDYVTKGPLILWGGADICPLLYGQTPHSRVFTHKVSLQDKQEALMALKAIEHGVPIIGVCRGAQLLCVLAGGSLVQDVDNHQRDHDIICTDNMEIVTTKSAHHQQMLPWDVDHELLAYAEGVATSFQGEDNRNLEIKKGSKTKEGVYMEPEVVWFPKIQALCIQGHPEWETPNSKMAQRCVDWMNKYVFKGVK